ncbi:MAG: F0F1 ATP synthase subunit B [Gemmatimonadota bacterium]|jgi:F-type H+-transporting ATPase subunit b
MTHLDRTTFVHRRVAPILGAVAVCVLLTPRALLAAGEGQAPGANLFGVNLGLSFWTVVVFLILLFLLSRFAWGPILSAVEAREDRIQNALDESARRQAEAQELLEEHRQQLADARRQAQEIIGEGKAAGERVRRDIEAKAREEGQRLLDRARREIEREKEKALGELRRESVELALAAAARLMREKMDASRDRQLVLGYLDDLGGNAGRSAPGSASREPETGA